MRPDGSGVRRLSRDLPAVSHPSWSPDGEQLAYYTDTDGSWDVYAVVVATGATRSLTDHPGFDGQPAWRPAPVR